MQATDKLLKKTRLAEIENNLNIFGFIEWKKTVGLANHLKKCMMKCCLYFFRMVEPSRSSLYYDDPGASTFCFGHHVDYIISVYQLTQLSRFSPFAIFHKIFVSFISNRIEVVLASIWRYDCYNVARNSRILNW